MKSKKYRLFSAIAAYLGGIATDKERKIVQQWLNENEGNVKKMHYLEKITYVGPLDQSEETKEKIYNVIRTKINNTPPTVKLEPSKFNPLKYVVAASVIALLILGGIWLYPFSSSKDNIAQTEISTPVATTTSVVLSDGSRVILNAGSSLSYPEKFTSNERRVELQGEAFFEVESKSDQPFIVSVNYADITVLGTKFNIKAYVDEDEIVTTLQEGAVRFNHASISDNKQSSILLKPDQQVILHKETLKTQLREVDARLYSSWKEGVYYFDNNSLEEISLILERGFNVNIEIQSPTSHTELFSGIFDKDESLEEILELLTKYRSIAYKIHDNKIIIYNE